MLFDTKIEHRTEPKRPIPEMWKEYVDLLVGTKRVGVKRLLGWLQSDMGNGTEFSRMSSIDTVSWQLRRWIAGAFPQCIQKAVRSSGV